MLQVKPVPRQVLCSHETKNTFENVPDDVGWCPEGPDLGQGAGLDVADRLLRLLHQRLDLLHLNLDRFLPPEVKESDKHRLAFEPGTFKTAPEADLPTMTYLVEEV